MLDSSTTSMMYHVGLDGFVWFVGIVEDRTSDPLKIGRCKVRILGHHEPDVEKLSTDDLPWALPLLPVTNSRGNHDLCEGDWVLGFFMDAQLAQQPVILGKFPSYPTDPGVGSQKNTRA